MTQIQVEQKAQQLLLNKEAARKLLLGLRVQLNRNTVSSITIISTLTSTPTE